MYIFIFINAFLILISINIYLTHTFISDYEINLYLYSNLWVITNIKKLSYIIKIISYNDNLRMNIIFNYQTQSNLYYISNYFLLYKIFYGFLNKEQVSFAISEEKNALS